MGNISINLLNPEAIVLAGGTLQWRGYLAAAMQSAQQYSLPDLWAACRLEVSPHGGDLVVLGAASMFKVMGYPEPKI